MVFITDEIRDKIEDLDIEQVASELGLAVKNHKALCFVHDDRHASLHFERNKKIISYDGKQFSLVTVKRYFRRISNLL